MESVITQGEAEIAFTKQGVDYWRCKDTGTLFSTPLPQEDKVGGQASEERNEDPNNAVRLERITNLTKLDKPLIFDYGCGKGQFIDYLREAGQTASGWDKFNPDYSKVHGIGKWDAVTMIEVIEHLSYPFLEFVAAEHLLKSGGLLYLESSFSDFLTEESDYINPELGHCTLFSHKGLDYLLEKFGFRVGEHINRNARIFYKV